MKKIDFYTKLSMIIMLIFIIIIFASFIPDYFPSFFGDHICSGRIFREGIQGCYETNCGQFYIHTPTSHWGYRHFIWMCMGLILFAIQIFRICDLIDKQNN